MRDARAPGRDNEATEGEVVCDLAELRQKFEGKNKAITEIKLKSEKAPGRLTAAKNTVGYVEDRNGRLWRRKEGRKTNEVK